MDEKMEQKNENSTNNLDSIDIVKELQTAKLSVRKKKAAIFGAIYAVIAYTLEKRLAHPVKAEGIPKNMDALEKYYEQYIMHPASGFGPMMALFVACKPSEKCDRRMGALIDMLDSKDANIRFNLEEQASLFVGMYHEKEWLRRSEEQK